MTLEVFYFIFSLSIGLLVGSFLNVVISRLPTLMMWEWERDAREFLHEINPDKSSSPPKLPEKPPGVVVKSSFCPKCKTNIKFYDNIPVLSYLFLRGKCRSCKTPISFQYPMVEMLMGALALLALYTWGFTPMALMGFFFFAVLLVCSGIDFKTQLIPDKIIIPAIWAALLWSLCPLSTLTPGEAIVGASVGYLSLWSFYWIFKIITKKEGMGYGDFKLLAFIGAFLGVESLLYTIMGSAIAGSIIGIVLLKMRGQSQAFPFGPFLAMGAIIYLIATNFIL